MTVGLDDKVISMEEVRQHNSPDDAWCAIHDGVYDVTKFAKAHPGGDIILLSAGKEATVLFETYHVRGVPDALLRKYRIGSLKQLTKEELANLNPGTTPSYYDWDSEFYNVLKDRVKGVLEERGLPRRGGYEIWIKAALLLTWFWSSLYGMCTLDPRSWGMACAISIGFAAAFVGTCIQHDGNHGAFAFNRTANKVAGWTLDMIGASAMTWEIQHVLGHHPYTNVIEEQNGLQKVNHIKVDPKTADQESDPDVFSTYPMLRLHPWHDRRFYHRFQHLYAPIIFGFMTINKVMTQDVGVFLRRRLFQIDANCRYASAGYRIRFVSMKILSILYMVGLPVYFHGVAQGIKLFLMAHYTCGVVLATMFIVNHVIENVSYVSKDSVGGKMAEPKTVFGKAPMQTLEPTKPENKAKVPYNDWAAVQCQTSVNWSCGSWFWNHFSGGLSHQVEHHLFPGICHTNYVYIHPVVKQTCAEYGVPYQSEESLFSAYKSMINHLYVLGNDPNTIWKKQN